ncbi:hypothetical protein A9Q81_10480 [Gammaproteobacteria bacterium 42_54_T18]|nr:hypothetical protein A9Q81_10480 [Gammaproteobacteria bacterium 42_54_T18]
MVIQVRDMMNTVVISVSPEIGLDVLESELTQHSISGAPVIENNKVVGVVSFSDIVKQLNIEHTYALTAYDYYEGPYITHGGENEVNQLGSFIGHRLEHLTVRDIMHQIIKSVSPDQPAVDAADIMLEHKVHRLLVLDDNAKLMGIVSSTDFVKLHSSPH